MAFADRVDEATKGIQDTGSERTDIRAAIKTCQTSLDAVFTTYGLNEKDEQAIEDKLIDLCRYMEAALR